MKKHCMKVIFAVAVNISLASCYAGESNKETSVPLKTEGAAKEAQVVNQNHSVNLNNHCKEKNSGHKQAPSMVLLGTDVVDRAEYESSEVEYGEFESEMGGAKIVLSIVSSAQGNIVVQRRYVEPGIPDDQKTFDGLCKTGSKIAGSAIVAEYVKGGVLWWEFDSSNEFIPSEMFIFFTRME